jgi:folate-dependent phosphoribosylglycinamide formyltransferase PurN
VVLLSGEGTELGKLLSYIDKGQADADIVAVMADSAGPHGLDVASERRIMTTIVDPAGFADTAAFAKKINDAIDKLKPDVVVLDGFAHRVRLSETTNRLVTDRADALLEIARSR